ncbi:MAG: AzlC family ABC transporter permease [Acidimicrobiia bacterium]|nr:AzlC family ABC transporter permease [Acidimicrobiia bacterium]
MFSFRGLILARSTSPRRTAESGGRSEPLLERYRLLLFEGNARALEPHRGVHTDYLADAVMQNARVRPDRPYARDAIALGAAVGVFGASFGVLSITAGLSVARTCVMSLLVFTGASQFAAIGVVAGGGRSALRWVRLSCSPPATPRTVSCWRRASAAGASSACSRHI